MADLLNVCRFTAGSDGTDDFLDGTAVTGFRNLDDGGGVDGVIYPYRAENADRSEWEIGEGTYSASDGALVRLDANVVDGSSGPGARVAFTTNPVVLITPLVNELLARRETLYADRPYYVRADGSDDDDHDGRENTSASAFATKQHAVNVVHQTLDLNGFQVTIQVVGSADSTNGVTVTGPFVGEGPGAAGQNAGKPVLIVGDATTPTNCPITTTNADCFFAGGGASLLVAGFDMSTVTTGFGCHAQNGGKITLAGKMAVGDFPNGFGPFYADENGWFHGGGVDIDVDGDYGFFLMAEDEGSIYESFGTVAATGTCNAIDAFAIAQNGGHIRSSAGSTFTGTFTGRRFRNSRGILCGNDSSVDPNYYPGDVAGFDASREILTANRTYYVRTDGDDDNTGLINSSGGAFLTIQKAIDTAASVDLGVYAITVQIADGTYTGANVLKPWVGGGSITIQGNSGTPGNVIVSTTGNDAFFGAGAGLWTIKDMELRTTTSGACIHTEGSTWVKYTNVRFGASVWHKYAGLGSTIECIGDFAIVGNADYHDVFATGGKVIKTGGLATAVTVTLTGTPAFTIFALGDSLGLGHYVGYTFSGAATGQRYNISNNTIITTNGGGASFLPGDTGGATATGAQYN